MAMLRHIPGFGRALLALVMAVLVLAPAIDRAVCLHEEIVPAAAVRGASADTAQVSQAQQSRKQIPAPEGCQHGHCHHAQNASDRAAAAAVVRVPAAQPTAWLVTTAIVSAQPGRLDRPPRA